MPKYLDLDGLPTGTTAERVLKLNGKEHPLKPMSVGDFIENTKLLQAQGDSPSLEREFEVMMKMIQRSFPSCSEAELMALTLPQLNQILDFVQDASGTDEAGEGKANPPVGEK
ncbi:MAG TPA: hypothetical protein VD978_12080 [Azospirillum sp.]|nr:hypothetical protein [Azospirillum sp.]